MTPKEFMVRWAEGIRKITPMQTIRVTLIGSSIILVGIILGIVVTAFYKQWWLLIILVGSLIVQGLSFIGTVQKYLAFKRIEIMTREVDL